MDLPRYLSAFSSRNYRLFFGGQVISLIGTWMTQTTSLWLIYHLTSNAFLLGVVGFASQVPMFILAPFAGVWVDRVNRHHLLITTQIASMLQSFALAALAFPGLMSARVLIALSLVQGLINAFDMPTRQSMVVEFIERKEHLGNAIALNSSMFNLARLAGPAIAGFVIAHFGSNQRGAGVCYAVDGASYIAVIIGLFAMRLPKHRRPAKEQHPWVAFREGFDYAFSFAPVRALILLVALVSFMGFSYTVLTPIFARDVFHGDARTLGWLMSASGVGALCGALYLGIRSGVRGLGKVITTGGVFMGAGLIGFALSRWLALSLACLTLVGMGGVLLMASSNTLVQTFVHDNKRGRVMSIFTMAFTGTMPLGNLVVGAFARKFGAPSALILGGVICGVAAFIFHRKLPKIRDAARSRMAELEVAALEPLVYPKTEAGK